MENIWWKEPMRVLQYNLQVRDTPGMDAEKIARETEEMAARRHLCLVSKQGQISPYQ